MWCSGRETSGCAGAVRWSIASQVSRTHAELHYTFHYSLHGWCSCKASSAAAYSATQSRKAWPACSRGIMALARTAVKCATSYTCGYGTFVRTRESVCPSSVVQHHCACTCLLSRDGPVQAWSSFCCTHDLRTVHWQEGARFDLPS